MGFAHQEEDQEMPRKRFKPEEIVAKLRQVEVLQSQGIAVAGAIRRIGVTEVTFYLYGRLSSIGAAICTTLRPRNRGRRMSPHGAQPKSN
jgi:putative transposase